MLFRYKIVKTCHRLGDLHWISYNTTIQRYNPNNVIFKWETREDTTLKCIAEFLSRKCFGPSDSCLKEITEKVAEYGSMDKMILEYIRRFVVRDIKLEDDDKNLEKTLDDNIVFMNHWNTIEIKENE